MPNDLDTARLAVLITKKAVNLAVIRNKVRRQIIGINKNPFVICKRGEFKILETINQREIIGTKVVIN